MNSAYLSQFDVHFSDVHFNNTALYSLSFSCHTLVSPLASFSVIISLDEKLILQDSVIL